MSVERCDQMTTARRIWCTFRGSCADHRSFVIGNAVAESVHAGATPPWFSPSLVQLGAPLVRRRTRAAPWSSSDEVVRLEESVGQQRKPEPDAPEDHETSDREPFLELVIAH